MVSVNTSARVQSHIAGNKRWIALGILLWLLFVISQVPASWGAWLMTRGGDQLALTGVTGSLWTGRASLASIKVNQKDYALGELHWSLKPLSLLLLKPCAIIKTRQDSQEIEGDVCVGIGGSFALYDTDINAPATLFQGILPLPFEGQFSARVEELQTSNQQLQELKGSISWTGARIYNGNNWMELGNYAAELNDDTQGGINAKIFNIDGPVQVQLDAAIAAAGGGTVKGDVVMSRGFAEQINAGAWISMFAQADGTDDQGNNRYKVDTNL